MTVLVIVVVVIVLVVLLMLGWGISTYNKLVRQRNQVDSSWAQIDVQLKRRHSLIPNLVETVKGYAGHERNTLEAVVAARNGAVQRGTTGPTQQAQAEGQLTEALGRLFALAEAYPQLKADQNFLQLQRELSNTEDKIAYARQFYNSAIQSFNTAIQTFPGNLIAGVGGFQARPFFEAVGGERADVNVRF
jgi:LemA protein